MNLIRWVGEQFGKPTGWGGRLSTWVMNRMNRRQYRAVLEALDIRDGDSVLDIGFGNGYLMRRVLRQMPPCRMHGIEISDDMLTLAARRLRRDTARGWVELRRGDVVELPYPDNHFDWVYTVNTVYFWSSLEQGLSEIARVLRPGGVFVHAFYSRQYLDRLRYTDYGFTKYMPEDLEQAAVRCGLTVERCLVLRQNLSCCLVARKPASHPLKSAHPLDFSGNVCYDSTIPPGGNPD